MISTSVARRLDDNHGAQETRPRLFNRWITIQWISCCSSRQLWIILVSGFSIPAFSAAVDFALSPWARGYVNIIEISLVSIY